MQSITVLILVAFGGFWITSVSRRLPRIESLAMAGVKPWACNACMSFWATIPLSGLHYWVSGNAQILGYIAAAGGCLLMLEILNPKPPTIPEPDMGLDAYLPPSPRSPPDHE